VAKRIPYIPQLELSDCGAACLAMVLAHHGSTVALQEIREVTGTGRDGVDALRILDAARHFGLEGRGVRADLDELVHLPPASILHWEFDHFVVFERLRRGHVDMVDPAVGRVRLPLATVGRAFTGAAVIFEPTRDLRAGSASRGGVLRHLRPVVQQSAALRRVLVVSVLLRVFALALPLLTAAVVNDVAPAGDGHLLAVVSAAMAAMVAYHVVGTFLRARLLLQLRTAVDVQMTLGFMGHLVDLPYAFFLTRSAGDLMTRLRSNSTVREILTTGAISTILDGGFAVLYLVALLALSPAMGALALGLAALQATVLVTARRRNQRLMAQSLHAEARSQSYVYQVLAGIEVLKAAGAERRAVDHWSGLFVEEVDVANARGRLDAVVGAVTAGLRLGAPLALLAIGTSQVLDGDLRLGTMLALVALGTGFLQPVDELITTGLQVQLLGSYLQRINDVLDTPAEQAGRTLRPAPALSGRIRAEGVTFRYAPLSPPAVADATLDVAPGSTVAIVGRSGSGKSTLAHLLVGLYEPDVGRVLYDGADLGELSSRSVRRQIGIVTQNAYVFGGSLRENITLTDPDRTRDEVERAARLACIHDDIAAMPLTYDTVLVDGGASLSGGQRQRVALARALVGAPSIVLLDEATSALDAITERQVFDNLAALGCTTIVIAHRLSTIATADTIVVMDRGRIVERGTHAELLAAGGAYHALVAGQGGPPARLEP
jgi:ATP-binding cassette subfamily B protein